MSSRIAPHQMSTDAFIQMLNPEGTLIDQRPNVTRDDLAGFSDEPRRIVASEQLPGGLTLLVTRTPTGMCFAELNGEIVGMASEISGGTEVVVDESVRGQGVGRILYRHFLVKNNFPLSGGFTPEGEAMARAVHFDIVAEKMAAGEVPEGVAQEHELRRAEKEKEKESRTLNRPHGMGR